MDWSILLLISPKDPMRQLLDSHTQSIAKLETQIGQLANSIASRDKGKLPIFPMENPRGRTYHEETKAVTTLRSGKLIQNKVFLNEKVSSILQYNTPPKLKDPGVPTITCFIGDKRIDRALLGLCSSVNLIPYSVYEELGLGELLIGQLRCLEEELMMS
ncbi:Retrovirus-related Pol polyprotein from transposon 17.6 [Senna tora]|uniref:Retrovirus-related Pol polyprotein from transposon 17.6 n=1 Tax=Senna tora TaxID=362788 RepID=A0A834WTE2_9FABA|nr:Retrovirus-related Pol polyprotein from transposon 17.6 [Senna tora]